MEDRLHSKVGEVCLAIAHYFGAEGSLRAFMEVLISSLVDVKFLLDLVDFLDGDVTGLFETIRNFERVDALLQQLLSLFENGSRKNNDASCSVTNFVVL